MKVSLKIKDTSCSVMALVMFVLLSLSITSGFFSLIAFLLAFVYIIFCKKQEDVWCFLFFLIPFAVIFKINPGQTSLFTLLVCEIVIQYLFRGGKIDIYAVASITVCFLFCSISGGLYGSPSYLNSIKICINLLLLQIAITSRIEIISASIASFFGAGLLLSSFLGIFKESVPRLSAFYADIDHVSIANMEFLRFSGLFQDPNYMCIAVIVAISLLIQEGLLRRIKWLSLIMVILLIGVGMTSYSKSFLLMLFATIFYFIYEYRKELPYAKICLFVTCFIIGFWGKICGYLFAMSSRIDGSNLNTLTTGRIEIWRLYVDRIGESWTAFTLGHGLGSSYVCGYAPHSLYIETVYYLGVVGFLVYILCLWFILWRGGVKKLANKGIFVFLAIGVMYTFLAGLTAYEFPFYMIVGYIFFKNWNSDETAKEIWIKG